MKKNGSGKRLRRLIPRDLFILHLTLKSSIVTLSIVIKYKILRDFQASLHYVSYASILLLFPLSFKIFIIHNAENKY